METNIEDIWPIMDIEDDCLLSNRADVTLVFKAELPEIFTLSDKEYEDFHHAWVKAVKVLPDLCVFHKQDWFLERQYKEDFSNVDRSFLSRCNALFFNERPYLQHSCYIMLTKKPSGSKPSNSLFSSLFCKSLVPMDVLDALLLQDFIDCATQFKRILEDSGFIKLSRLSRAELESQSDRIGLLEQYLFLSEDNASIIYKDISFENGLQIGDKHGLLISLGDAVNLPSHCGPRINYDNYCTDKTKFSVGFACSLGQLLSCNHIYNQYLFIEDGKKIIQRLESKKLRLQSLSAYSRANRIARDAIDEFLNEAFSQHKSPIKAHFNVFAWCAERGELKDIKNKISAALAQINAVAKQETVGAPQIYWAGLPGNEADFPMNDTFDTFAEQALCFLNLETTYESSLSPMGIRLGDRITGKPLHIDISDEPMKRGICNNRNKFILGPSGSGKSFFTNHMIRSYYEQGTHIVLVDIGHSYKPLCDVLGGYYFTYDAHTPICFNPFYIGDGDSLDTEKKESIKTLLLALWKKDSEEYNRSEYVAISNALVLYYDTLEKQKHIFPCFNSFYEFIKEEFSTAEQDKNFDLSNFLYVLRPYYKGGEFDYLLNATQNLELLQEPFIVFELDTIKDHPILFTVVTIIIMEIFISKLRKLKGIRKMILIEEAWKAIAKEGMAEYIRYAFKTVRKYFGEAVVVTQEIEDIISSEVVKQTIINNSDCKILLDQRKYQNKFDQIQQLLGLTDKEKTLLLSLNKANDTTHKYKEVFISLGGMYSKVYRMEVSPTEHYTYTTEETERQMVNAYLQKFDGDIKKALSAVVLNRMP